MSLRRVLAEMMGAGWLTVLHMPYTPEAPSHLHLVPAIDVLRCIWSQHYWTNYGTIRWWQEANWPPHAQFIVS
jgi:hypothetical protein